MKRMLLHFATAARTLIFLLSIVPALYSQETGQIVVGLFNPKPTSALAARVVVDRNKQLATHRDW